MINLDQFNPTITQSNNGLHIHRKKNEITHRFFSFILVGLILMSICGFGIWFIHVLYKLHLPLFLQVGLFMLCILFGFFSIIIFHRGIHEKSNNIVENWTNIIFYSDEIYILDLYGNSVKTRIEDIRSYYIHFNKFRKQTSKKKPYIYFYSLDCILFFPHKKIKIKDIRYGYQQDKLHDEIRLLTDQFRINYQIPINLKYGLWKKYSEIGILLYVIVALVLITPLMM